MKIWVKVLIAVAIAVVVSLIIFLITFPPDVGPPILDIENKDNHSHLFMVEIFDSNDHLIFNNSFILDPGEFNRSPRSITEKTGMYKVKATVDGNLTKEQWIEIGITTEVVYVGLKRLDSGLNVEITTIVI